MNTNSRFALLIIIALSALSGCYTNGQLRGSVIIPIETQHHTTVIRRYPPPPYAPRNGYRYYYYDQELRYDADFGLYVVIGSPGLYYYDDHYFRYYRNGWQTRNRLNSVWQPAHEREIPARLLKARRHAREHPRGEQRYKEPRREHREERREEPRKQERHERNGKNKYRDAPRQGEHRRYQNSDLIYDQRIGAYSVKKRPGIYFYNKRYVRRYRDTWQSSNKLNGVWRPARQNEVPERLMKPQHRESHERGGDRRQRNQLNGIWQP